jgi:hypothetical protein
VLAFPSSMHPTSGAGSNKDGNYLCKYHNGAILRIVAAAVVLLYAPHTPAAAAIREVSPQVAQKLLGIEHIRCIKALCELIICRGNSFSAFLFCPWRCQRRARSYDVRSCQQRVRWRYAISRLLSRIASISG